MNPRTKIFAIVLGAVGVYAVLAGAVYPHWVRPLLSLDERIVERQKDLDKLNAEAEAVQNARYAYKELVGRVGSFDPGKVETDVRDRLNQLIEKHKLADANTTPTRPVEDRKTGLFNSTITVSGTGTLEASIGFLKDAAELPFLARLGNVSLSPAGGARKAAEKDLRFSLRVPVDVWVLPKNRVVGPIEESGLTRPQMVVRHASRDYQEIAKKKPFSYWEPPIPLKATIARPINVEKGQPATLEGSANGGDGEYVIEWSPTDGLSDPKNLRPTVDTSTPGTKSYTLSVTDGTGKTVTASTSVSIREPKPQEQVVQTPPPPPPPPPPPKRQRWPDSKSMDIKMALLRKMGTERLDEFMVENKRSHETKYYKVGDEFDGGTLEFVHQLGGVVSWRDEYYVYPLGNLDQHLGAGEAGEFPELQGVAEKLKDFRRKSPPSIAPQVKADKPALPTAVVPQHAPAPTAEVPPAVVEEVPAEDAAVENLEEATPEGSPEAQPAAARRGMPASKKDLPAPIRRPRPPRGSKP